jgi:uncharacterized membrane protein YdjX (TVP38/TMEM64 family)
MLKVSVKKSYIALCLVLLFLAAAAYFYFSRYTGVLADPQKIKRIITSYGKYGILAFISLQMLQVIAFFIPGEVVQIAGGFIYGTFWGSVLSLAGITVGSAIIYWLSRIYGKPLVMKLVSKRHHEFFDRLLKLGSSNYVIFMIYLIPGIPKDMFGYICGLSEVGFGYFLLYSTLGRLPALIISSYFGAGINDGDDTVLIAIAVVMTILFIIGVFKGESIIRRISGKRKDRSAG